MRKILLFLLLCSTTVSFSQQGTGSSKRSLKQPLLSKDSTLAKLQEFKDSAEKVIEIRRREDGNIKAMLEIVEKQNARRAKEKRNAYIRIGIAVAFLVVLIVGLVRKRAKK